MSNRRSFFQKVFGDELGGIIQAYLGAALLMLVIPGIVFGFRFFLEPRDDGIEKLKNIPQETRVVVEEIIEVQKRTDRLLQKLDKDIKASEEQLNQKKAMLERLEKQHKMLELTPEQMKIIQDYSNSLNEPSSFRDWIKRRQVIYDIITTTLISAFFFWLGLKVGKKTKKED